MTNLTELNLATEDEVLLQKVEDAVLADDDFTDVQYEELPDGKILIKAIYAGTAYIYHQDVHYGNSPGARIQDTMTNEGLDRPDTDRRIGVKTDNVEDKVVVENVYEPGGGA